MKTLQALLWLLALTLLVGAACDDDHVTLIPECKPPPCMERPDCPEGQGWACSNDPDFPKVKVQEWWVQVTEFCWCIPTQPDDEGADDEQADQEG